MKYGMTQAIIKKIREKIPLRIRQIIGPIVAYIFYFYNFLLKKNIKQPKVLSINKTIDMVLEKELSVIRFGDGEISLIDGLDLGFQKNNLDLSKKLEFILQYNNERLLICIPGIWDKLDKFEPYAYHFNMHHLYRYGYIWKKLLSFSQIYGDTNMTRHYLAFKDKTQCGSNFNKLFSIWKNKDVVLIEGIKSRLGVGNNMFDNVKSLQRILCPPNDAFLKYEEIKKEVIKINKDKLILLSLGPTAKILAYDLFLLGYRVIDIGHIDMEYEMFLRKSDKQVKVRYKYFNEIHERDPEDCMDEKYRSQIVVRIE